MADETISFLCLISVFFPLASNSLLSAIRCNGFPLHVVHAAPYVDDEIFFSLLLFRRFLSVASEDIIKQCDGSYQK